MRIHWAWEERLQPVREAANWLLRNRKVTVPVALSLALGIGANTAIFTLVDAVFLEPVPVPGAERVVSIHTHDSQNPRYLTVSFPNYLDLRQRSKSFEHLSATTETRVNVGVETEVFEANAELATGNYFAAVSVFPAHGQAFDDDGLGKSEEVPRIVISDALWRKRFRADPQIVGKAVQVNRTRFTVAGIMPAHYKGLDRIRAVDLWIPMRSYGVVLERPDWMLGRRALLFRVLGRLRAGVSMDAAAREVDAIGKELAASYPESNAERSYRILGVENLAIGPAFREQFLQAAGILMGASGTVLLIAIANVGNLLLSRAASRRRDMAVRLALGATRRTLFRQILWETGLLVLVAGILGLAVGFVGRELLWQMRPPDITRDDLWPAFSTRVFLFVAMLSVATGFLASILPAWETLRGNLTSELRDRSAGARQLPGLRQVLVVGQVALSMSALVGAHVFVRSMANAYAIDPGFDTRHLTSFDLNAQRLGLDGDARQDLYLELRARMQHLKGVENVAVSSDRLLDMGGLRRTVFTGECRVPGCARIVRTTVVSEEFFATTDMLILRGRDFSKADCSQEPPVAIVNETMARASWPDESAVGKKIRFFGDDREHEVIGVARDSVYVTPGEKTEPVVYTPLRQNSPPAAVVILRSNREVEGLREDIAAALKAYRPDLPEVYVEAASVALDEALWTPRMAATLLSTFGVLALLLASVGVYSVTAQMVSQRTAEMGVRMAMGACPVDVMELLLRQCFTMVLPGVAIGSVISFLLARLVFQDVLYGVDEANVEPYLLTSLLLAVVALIAMYLPARRMVRIAPAMVLREQ